MTFKIDYNNTFVLNSWIGTLVAEHVGITPCNLSGCKNDDTPLKCVVK